jgi:hypothetical protein
MSGPRSRPYQPRPAWVRVDDEGQPVKVNNRAVEQIAEEWLVSDRWWTPRPLRRHYFELICAGGANVTAYRDVLSGCWFTQRA